MNMINRTSVLLLCLILCSLAACGTPAAVSIPPLQIAPYGGESCGALQMPADLELEQHRTALPVYQMEIASVDDMKAEVERVLGVSFPGAGQQAGNSQYHNYRIGDADVMLDEELGFWTYEIPLELTVPKNLPSDEEAVAIADAFLEQAELYNGALRHGSVSYTTTESNGPSEILRKNVYYYPEFDGFSVYGVFRIVIGIGDDGSIVSVWKQVQNVTEAASVRLVEPEAL